MVERPNLLNAGENRRLGGRRKPGRGGEGLGRVTPIFHFANTKTGGKRGKAIFHFANTKHGKFRPFLGANFILECGRGKCERQVCAWQSNDGRQKHVSFLHEWEHPGIPR